jgi:hypothetical protein
MWNTDLPFCISTVQRVILRSAFYPVKMKLHADRAMGSPEWLSRDGSEISTGRVLQRGVLQSGMQRLDLGGVRQWPSHLAAIAVLLAFSVLQCRSLLGALSSSVPANRFSGDTGQGVWYMAWLPFALGHGLDPFISHLQFAPAGFNLLSNTGMLFPALLLSPVTVTAGPVAAFNVGLLAAPVVSGGCLYFVCRRLGMSWAGGLVAGTLFGFSPYLMHEAPFGHFNLTWLFFPPLAYYLLRRILLDEGSASRQGLALGALVVVQYFTSTEILLDCVILAVPMTLIFLARHVRDGPRAPKRLLIALSCACLVAVPLLAYPLWVTLAGPYHVLLNPAKVSGIPLPDPAWPSAHSRSAAGFFTRAGSGFVGPGAIVIAAAALFWWRQVREVAHFAAGAVIAFVLALGPNIRTARSVLLRTSPIAWFAHVPLLRAIVPYRFSGLMVMFIALLCATTITQVSRSLAELGPSRRVAVARWSTSALLAAAVLVLPLLADRFPSGVEHIETPTAVSAAVTPGGRNATVAVYPAVGVFNGDPLVWQALCGMSFRLTDGYAFIRERNGTIGFIPPPTITNILFAAAQLGTLRPGLTRAARAAVADDLRRSQVSGLVLLVNGKYARRLDQDMRQVLGPPTFQSASFDSWDNVALKVAARGFPGS